MNSGVVRYEEVPEERVSVLGSVRSSVFQLAYSSFRENMGSRQSICPPTDSESVHECLSDMSGSFFASSTNLRLLDRPPALSCALLRAMSVPVPSSFPNLLSPCFVLLTSSLVGRNSGANRTPLTSASF